jgi:hypothetical protein
MMLQAIALSRRELCGVGPDELVAMAFDSYAPHPGAVKSFRGLFRWAVGSSAPPPRPD